MPARSRSQGDSPYGYAHRKRAAELHAMHRDGDICRRCGKEMFKSQRLQAGHPDDAPAWTGGLPDALEHGYCNQKAGQRNGEASKRRRRAPRRVSRDW